MTPRLTGRGVESATMPDDGEENPADVARFDAIVRNTHLWEELRNAITLRKDYVEAINNAGVVLQDLGRTDDALAGYRLILSVRPSDAEAHNNLGAALLAQGHPDAAMSELQQAVALKPDYPEAYYNLGNAWRELGKIGGALAAYQTALRLRPEFADAFSQFVYHRRHGCDWTDYEADQKRLLDMVRTGTARVPPFYLLATPASAEDIRIGLSTPTMGVPASMSSRSTSSVSVSSVRAWSTKP